MTRIVRPVNLDAFGTTGAARAKRVTVMLGAVSSIFTACRNPRALRLAVTVALFGGSSASSACGGSSSSSVLPLQAASADQWTCKDWQDEVALGADFTFNQPPDGSTGAQGLATLTDDLHQQHAAPFVNSNGYKLSAQSEQHLLLGFIEEVCRTSHNPSFAPGPKAAALTYRNLLKYEAKALDATTTGSPTVSPSSPLPPVTQNSGGSGNSGTGSGGGGSTGGGAAKGTTGGTTGGGNTGNTGGGTTGGTTGGGNTGNTGSGSTGGGTTGG